jgi:hypothetical protein
MLDENMVATTIDRVQPCRSRIMARESPRDLGQYVEFGSQDEKSRGGFAEPMQVQE